ncbi:RluA family pseudouridine synthase [Acetobacteraceae bacterium H6797]|nr:RluA family pseudouridine synthase [Acetobacteraceae bacterium H6797]
MSIQQRTVAADDADIRLDRWFRRHFPALTQGALQKMCRTGQVRVDGKRVETNTRLAGGQVVRIPPMPDAPLAKPAAPRVKPDDEAMLRDAILYSDGSVIVLNKPPGLPVQGGPGISRHLDGMLEALRFDAEQKPRLVHRLDRDTSGVLLLARTPSSAAKLAAAFRSRDTHKTYWAVVVGRPHPLEGRINMSLAKLGGTPHGERVVPDEGPESAHAITDYRVIDTALKSAALLEMNPVTGRTHQLRVHAASALGTPILGDGKYGEEEAHIEGLSRQLHLHARAISLPHPEGGTLEVAAPLPPHMAETFKFFGFDVPKTPAAWRKR